MYSTKLSSTETLEDLLSKIDDYDIYAYYMGNFTIGKLYNSPLRTDDKIPSFAIFKGRRGNLMFKDHGSGESGNAISFIKLIDHITDQTALEKQLLKIIRSTKPTEIRNRTVVRSTDYTVDIGIVRQPFTKIDIDYWNQFNISLDTLNKFQVFSIKYYLSNNIVKGIYKDENPMYAYKVFDKFKIYRPLASKYTKWRTNLTTSDVQGLAQIPEKGDLLIITKSLKDVMVLYEMGYTAISAASETTFIPEDILSGLKEKWKHIVLLYDRDKAGMQNARKYSKQYNLPAFFINKKFKSKDISDAVKNCGFDNIKQWLIKELKCYD